MKEKNRMMKGKNTNKRKNGKMKEKKRKMKENIKMKEKKKLLKCQGPDGTAELFSLHSTWNYRLIWSSLSREAEDTLQTLILPVNKERRRGRLPVQTHLKGNPEAGEREG